MEWMAAAHSILTFPLLFALSLFNETRVQAVPHLKLVAAWCMPQCSVPYLLMVQLGPVSRLCHTKRHAEDPMEAVISHSLTVCNGPIYSNYGNSPYRVGVSCTCCAKGSKAKSMGAHGDTTYRGFEAF